MSGSSESQVRVLRAGRAPQDGHLQTTGIRDEIMASSKEYLNYVLDLLGALDGVTSRSMMGGYIIYYRDKIVGGIYADRFMLKATDSAKRMLPDAVQEPPYEGAKPMILVDTEDRELLKNVVEAMWPELTERQPRKRKKAT